MAWMKADIKDIEQAMRQHNIENKIKCKGQDPSPIRARVVFKASCFDTETDRPQRIYEFSSDNKNYIAGQSSTSVFLKRVYPLGDNSLFTTDLIKIYGPICPNDLEWAGIEIR